MVTNLGISRLRTAALQCVLALKKPPKPWHTRAMIVFQLGDTHVAFTLTRRAHRGRPDCVEWAGVDASGRPLSAETRLGLLKDISTLCNGVGDEIREAYGLDIGVEEPNVV